MEWLQLEWLQPILWLVGIGLGLWVIPNKFWAKLISFFGTKLVPALNKGESLLDAGGAMAEGAGFEKLGTAMKAGADVAGEIEDLPRLLMEYSADGKIDTEELKSLIDEGYEAGVSVKELITKIIELIKKKDEE